MTRKTRRVSNLTMGAKVSSKFILNVCVKPLATSLAFSFSSVSSMCIFALNTYLLVIMLAFNDDVIISHVSFATKAMSSILMTSF